MKIGVLFSGGKDSCYALYKAIKEHEVVCLISLISKNKESYMFHTPNINLTKIQAEAIGLPLLQKETKGEKEKELEDLKEVLIKAKERYNIEGVATGAIKSNYQKNRVEKICKELKLKCYNPLWQKDEVEYWNFLLKEGFKVIIISVSSEGLNKEWLGREIDKKALEELILLSRKFKFHLAFEGGEAETFVIDCPIFKKRIELIKARKEWDKDSGVYIIEKVKLVNK